MKMRFRLSLLAVIILFVLTGCDSGDPADEARHSDVAGEYRFTEFVFTPTAQVVQPINVLDTLVTSDTHLNLSSGGNFIFAYKFVEGDLYFLTGSFSVTERTVRIDGLTENRSLYSQILLREDFTLRRDETNPNVLTADIELTDVNPSAFSDRYKGIGSLDGTLSLRLVIRQQ
jgi:hypothetical protein